MNAASPPSKPSDTAEAGTSPRTPARRATCAITRRSYGASGSAGVSGGTVHITGHITGHMTGPAGPGDPLSWNQPRAARSARVTPNPSRSSRLASTLTTAGDSAPGGESGLASSSRGGITSSTKNRSSHPAAAAAATGTTPSPP
jgi:hypothetical protein